jgi:hypothetical protein
MRWDRFFEQLRNEARQRWPGLLQEPEQHPPCRSANVLSNDKAEGVGRIDLKQFVGYRTNR